MKINRPLTRRDFLKLAGLGTSIIVPSALGYSVFRSAQGEYPIEGSPYVGNLLTSNLDGSVPILLIVNQDSQNPFGFYLGEILRAEGLNCFHTADLSNVQDGLLEKYVTTILAETPLNTAQAEIFAAYVARGGRLVSMRPDDRLLSIFGLERSAGSLSEGYIKTESSHPAGVGIYSSSMQFHGLANLYPAAGAEVVAWLYADRDTSTGYPAVALNKAGDGMTVAFAFDLAKSIAYTRQGNPAFSDQDRDGHPFIRATDMFVDWIDLARIAIPQADEQQRLFVKLIYEISGERMPLPRLWYLPDNADALMIATGDAHPVSGADVIEDVLTKVEQRGGHMSIYYSFTLHDDLYRFAQRGRFLAGKLPVAGSWLQARFRNPTPDQVSGWRARGHEFTVHPHVGTDICGGFGVDAIVPFSNLKDGWETYWRQFTGLGYGPVSQTVRTHCVLWKGWTETARLQASYGIRMNFDYYHVGPAFRQKNGNWVYGHFTGSGLPMRFVDEQGRLLEIYQQITQLADEHFFSLPEINWVQVGDYTAEAALGVAKDLIQSGLDHSIPAAFGMQFHPDPFAYGGRPAEVAGLWLDGMLDYAVEMGIPIWSAQEWLQFTRTRQGADVHAVVWDERSLTMDFVVEARYESATRSPNRLVLMIPSQHKDFHLVSIEVDKSATVPRERWLSGVLYLWIQISSGSHKIVAHYAA